MTALHMSARDVKRLAKNIKVTHLLRRTQDEPGHITRYVAFCGATGTASRDFSANLTRKGVQIVTCQSCIFELN